MSTITALGRLSKPATVLVKVAMAVSGVGMASWVTLHMAGNLLWLFGPDVMDTYGRLLHGSGVLWPVHLLLVGGLVVHVIGAVLTTQQSCSARPVRYRHGLRPIASSVSSRSMRWTGGALLAFGVYHVLRVYGVGHAGHVPGAFHHNLSTLLSRPLEALLLAAATGLLCTHLAHGLASAWASVGLVSERREPQLRAALRLWSGLVTAGFLAPLLVRWWQLGPGL